MRRFLERLSNYLLLPPSRLRFFPLGKLPAPSAVAKVRRLYDIANVLSSLNLIEETQQVDTRKPAFRWLGLNGKRENVVTVAVPSSLKKGCKRGFGTEITNMDLTKRSKLVDLVDQKPDKVQMRSEDLKECNVAAQKQLQSSKGYDFGPFSPLGKKVMASEGNRSKTGRAWLIPTAQNITTKWLNNCIGKRNNRRKL